MSYVSAVTDFFSTRQGSVFVFSPADYAVVAEWEKQEIPLAFVLETIDGVLGDARSRSGKVVSIADLNGSVNAKFGAWLQQRSSITSC